MTFTYAGTLTTDLERVRFRIGDTSSTSGAGVKPDGTNYTDEEIGAVITVEGSWQKATAAMLETLATVYARSVDFNLGPRGERLSQAAAEFRQQAAQWRKEYGYGAKQSRAGSRAPTRVDGYSNDIPADQVDE